MNYTKKILILFMTSTILIAVLAGCNTNNAEPEQPKVINISYSLRPINIPSIVALEKRIFEEEFANDGIEVKWFELEGPAITEALASESIDIATSLNYVSAIITKANGNDIKIVSSYSRFPQAIGLVAGVDSGVISIADLKGKKIALQKGTMLHEMLIRVLENKNLTENDVEIVGMPSPDAANALLQGHVHAAILPDPIMTKVISSEKAVLLTTAEDLILGQGLIAVRSEFLADYPEIVNRFLEVHQQTLIWTEKNVDESLEIASEVIQMDINTVKILYPKFDFSMNINRDNIDELKESALFLKQNGFLKPDISTGSLIDSLVDTSILTTK